jgi:hypothetical protein
MSKIGSDTTWDKSRARPASDAIASLTSDQTKARRKIRRKETLSKAFFYVAGEPATHKNTEGGRAPFAGLVKSAAMDAWPEETAGAALWSTAET